MATFSAPRRIRFGDCDPAGIVYFPTYMRMLDGVVEDFFAALGHHWTYQQSIHRIATPTAHLSCDFVKPGRHGDELTFNVTVERIGRTSVSLAHDITRDGETMWSAKQVLVMMDMNTKRPQPIPPEMRTALEAFNTRPDAGDAKPAV